MMEGKIAPNETTPQCALAARGASSCGATEPCGDAPENTASEVGGSARRCLVTGETFVKTRMIRFVRAPDGLVVPDLAEKLPGRGLWVAAQRAALSEAARKNPFSRAAKAPCRVDPALAETLEALLRRRCLDFLGLAKAAGLLVLGEPQVEAALKKGTLLYILLAADAGRDVRKKLAKGVLVCVPFDREALGSALGRETLVSIGLLDHPLANKLRDDCARLAGVARPDQDPDQVPDPTMCDKINGNSERP